MHDPENLQLCEKGIKTFLHSAKKLQFFNFVGRLSHKKLPLKFINLFHISESLRLELRSPFSVNMGYFSHNMFST